VQSALAWLVVDVRLRVVSSEPVAWVVFSGDALMMLRHLASISGSSTTRCSPRRLGPSKERRARARNTLHTRLVQSPVIYAPKLMIILAHHSSFPSFHRLGLPRPSPSFPDITCCPHPPPSFRSGQLRRIGISSRQKRIY
jgi:hypothetical protein